jgi:DNA primase
MAMIPPDKVQEIKNAVRILEVIQFYVELKKVGVNYVGRCPFHGGKSFNVTPSKNLYKCFGCGKSGNAITFLMEARQKTYPEALQSLAEQFNIIL